MAHPLHQVEARFAPRYRAPVRTIGSRFEIPGEQIDWAPLGSGHIHETFVSTWGHAGTRVRYVHQRLNTHVFRDIRTLMENVGRVTNHLWRLWSEEGVPDPERRCLRLVPSRNGHLYHVDEEGSAWRTVHFIGEAHTHDQIRDEEQALKAARAFGTFLRMLDRLPPPPLSATIPDFHGLEKRFASFEKAVGADTAGRARAARVDIDAASTWSERLGTALVESGFDALPLRVVHNDCKLNNVLMDDATGEGLCVIDLDTVMEGTVLWDFGELVRTATSRAAEDEVRLESITFDLDLFGALARGYQEGAGALLSHVEQGLLPLAGPALALENAVRFLTDHLEGDVYFRIHREGHNLDRCRSQLRRVELMMANLDEARRRVLSGAAGVQ